MSHEKKRVIALIAARGGSKGIPNKNLIDICGKPLLAWTIEHAKAVPAIEEVVVSSDSEEILRTSEAFGAIGIPRPSDIANDTATSESAWLHALHAREAATGLFDIVVALQATSPIREPRDLKDGLDQFMQGGFDSLLSVCEVEDFFNWRLNEKGLAESVNYDWRERRRRQEIEKRYLENGSFYIFHAHILRETKNRLGGRIGMHVMDRHKMFQIDRPEDVELCAAIMHGYNYA